MPYRPTIFDTASIAITDAQILQMNCISDGPLPSKENGVILEIMEAKRLLRLQPSIRLTNKGYLKRRMASLENKYQEGTGSFNIRKRYATMKNKNGGMLMGEDARVTKEVKNSSWRGRMHSPG